MAQGKVKMADELRAFLEVLELQKQICEEVRRSLFVADRETDEKLGNNSVELIIALVIASGQLQYKRMTKISSMKTLRC